MAAAGYWKRNHTPCTCPRPMKRGRGSTALTALTVFCGPRFSITHGNQKNTAGSRNRGWFVTCQASGGRINRLARAASAVFVCRGREKRNTCNFPILVQPARRDLVPAWPGRAGQLWSAHGPARANFSKRKFLCASQHDPNWCGQVAETRAMPGIFPIFKNLISDIRNEYWDYLLRCDIVELSPLYLNDMDLTRPHRRVFFCLPPQSVRRPGGAAESGRLPTRSNSEMT